ncbi:MAG TPA: NDP-sugar synthase [Vicinamibacteria bacterium]|nr:NDP-sugar synthase [Vicinamibacteria bacterium]
MITYVLDWMYRGGLDRLTVCSDTESRAVRECVDRAEQALRITHLQDGSPRGPAGCLRDAAARTDAQTLVAAEATAFPVVELEAVLAAHRAASAAVTVVVGRDATGRLSPAGAYVLDRSVCAFVPEHGFYDIKEQLLPRLYAAGQDVRTYTAEALAPKLLNVDSYLALNEWVIARFLDDAAPPEGFEARQGAYVHRTASVDGEARLLGPVLVGPGASVGRGATVVGPASIGAGSAIGADAVVSRSVIAEGSLVGERAFVDRSVVAARAEVAAGSVVFSAVHVDRPADGRSTWLHQWRVSWASIRGAHRIPETQSP